jgi:hypothetical protein
METPLNITSKSSLKKSLSVLFAALALAACSVTASAQSAPAAVPVPFVTGLAGFGISPLAANACAGSIANTNGSNYGDNCPAGSTGGSQLSSPQGVAVDKYGNVYVADYSDRLIRVVYYGGAAVAAAITAANSGYTISATRNAPAVVPQVGYVYTIAGFGGTTTTALTATNSGGAFYCANYAATNQPTALDNLGDGCPAATAIIGARDVALDSAGNLFLTDYTDSRVRVLCVSCTAGSAAATLITLENPGVTPVNGAMYTIAGFSTGYRDGPGYFGATSASSTVALLRSPTQSVVTPSEDVYIADNIDNAVRLLYNGGAPALAVLTAEGYTGSTAPVIGNVYTVVGDNCTQAPTTNSGSSTTYECALVKPPTGYTADTVSLGNTQATGIVWSVYLDANSNLFYTSSPDTTNDRVKVLYAGVAAPLTLPNATYATLKTGDVYTFAGGGTTGAGLQDGVPPFNVEMSSAESIGGDANGNIFFIDYTTGLFYETYAQNGLTAIIGGGNAIATAAAGAYCNGGTAGPQMTDAYYDGCPATQVKFASPRGPIVADASGNLYFGDSVGYFVRKFTYNPTFPTTAVGATSATQPYAFTFLSAQTLTAPTLTAPDFADAGSDTCTTGFTATAGDPGNTCVINVSFKPTVPGLRSGAVELSSAAAALGASLFTGTATGSGLAVDPGTATTNGSGYVPNGIAVDSAARVYFTDSNSKTAIRYTGGTATTIATGFTTPTGIAADGADNIFVADSTANTITEVPITGTKFTLTSSVSKPNGLATDGLGHLYVADTGNNRILIFGPATGNAANTTTGAAPTPFTVAAFTGLSAPQDVAVDLSGNLYAIDSAHIVKLTSAGVQTTAATTGGTALAVDAAGNLLVTTGTTLVEYPANGSAAVTLYTTLISPKGVAIDGAGNAYIADNGAGGFLEFQRTAGYYKFVTNPATTNIELTSIGTAAVSSTAYTQTDTTDYTLTPSTTNGCSGALAAGSVCGLTATFNPKTAGVVTDNVTFTAPVSNGAPTLTLTTVSLVPAISVQPSSTKLTYGNTETLTATIYGPSNTSGTVNFYAGTTLLASVAAQPTATATYTYTPAVGTYSITANFTPTGSTSPTVTSQPVSITVTQATPSVGITLSSNTAYTTTSVTISATVTATGGTPSGTVSFYAGTTALGTSALSTAGAASITVSGLPVGTDCITAVYSGDSNYVTATSSCANITVSAGFGVTASSTALAFQPNYQEAQANLTVNTGGRTDTLTFVCNGLPAKISCAFTPATLTLAGGTAAPVVQMLVSNSGAAASLRSAPRPGSAARTIALAALPFAALLLFSLRRRKIPMLIAIALLSFATIGNLSGCGSGPTATEQSAGSYAFTVAVNSGTTTLQTLNFTLTIP